MTKKVILQNGRCWLKQGDALAHFKAMLGRYRNGDVISDSQDHDDLRALITSYDAARPAGMEAKIGIGLSHFSREVNHGEKWRSPGFHVHRQDGSSIDFSYIEAVKLASS